MDGNDFFDSGKKLHSFFDPSFKDFKIFDVAISPRHLSNNNLQKKLWY